MKTSVRILAKKISSSLVGENPPGSPTPTNIRTGIKQYYNKLLRCKGRGNRSPRMYNNTQTHACACV